MKIKVTFKTSYGKKWYVPENEELQIVLKSLRRAAFTSKELDFFKKEGVEVEIVNQ